MKIKRRVSNRNPIKRKSINCKTALFMRFSFMFEEYPILEIKKAFLDVAKDEKFWEKIVKLQELKKEFKAMGIDGSY